MIIDFFLYFVTEYESGFLLLSYEINIVKNFPSKTFTPKFLHKIYEQIFCLGQSLKKNWILLFSCILFFVQWRLMLLQQRGQPIRPRKLKPGSHRTGTLLGDLTIYNKKIHETPQSRDNSYRDEVVLALIRYSLIISPLTRSEREKQSKLTYWIIWYNILFLKLKLL